MCVSSWFGGGKSAPAPTPMPPPAPTPVATEGGGASDAARRAALQKMRMGLASTIKTSPRGLTGSGANLVGANQSGKSKLGA
jgi:hypothetical protein